MDKGKKFLAAGAFVLFLAALVFLLAIPLFQPASVDLTPQSLPQQVSPSPTINTLNPTTPPGCLPSTGIAGGCFGQNTIVDLKVEPTVNCFEISANDCSGAVLEIYNNCTEAIFIQGKEFVPADGPRYVYVYWMKDSAGNLVQGERGPESYKYPKENEFVAVQGKVGNQEFTISYVRTKALC